MACRCKAYCCLESDSFVVVGGGFESFCCSPSGKLVQIEYALTAVGAGQTSLGIKG